jgi:hypothetical protein
MSASVSPSRNQFTIGLGFPEYRTAKLSSDEKRGFEIPFRSRSGSNIFGPSELNTQCDKLKARIGGNSRAISATLSPTYLDLVISEIRQ